MSQAATPLITPIALPAVKRRDIPAAVAGAMLATLAAGYAVSYAAYHINPAQATFTGSMGFHFTSLIKSGIDMLGGGFEGYAHKYWVASQEVGLISLWRVGLAYALALTAGIFTYKTLAVEIDPILHYEGRKLVKPEELDAESKRAASSEGGAVVQLGKISINRERISRSVAIVGSTGGGKTVTINTICKDLDANGYSMMIVDGPKGDFASYNGFYLEALRIAPWHSGALWDIARDCPTRAAARELSKRLIPSNDKDPFWSNCAQFVFIVGACYLIETLGDKWGWSELWEACNASIEVMKERAAVHYPPAEAVFVDAESKTTQSVMINCAAFLADVFEMSQAWGDPPEDWVKFSFVDWLMERGESGKQRHVIIQTSGEWESTGRAFCASVIGMLAKIVVSPSFKESKTRKKVTVIDELAQMGKLEGLEKYAEAGRSKKCSLVLATQTPHQLIEIYGENFLNGLFAMLGVRIYVRTLGAADQEWVSKQIGRREIDTPTNSVSASAGGFTTTNSFQRGEAWVIHPSKLQKIGPNKKLGGVNVVVDGFDDVSVTFIKFPDFEAVREPFDLNPRWNVAVRDTTKHENETTKAPEVEYEDVEIEAVQHKTEITMIENNTSSEGLEMLLTGKEMLLTQNNTEHEQNNEETEVLEPIGENVFEPAIDAATSELIGADVHGMGQILDLIEALEGSDGGEIDNKTVVATTNTQKKKQFMTRKQMKEQPRNEK